jgi:hypothetical protein
MRARRLVVTLLVAVCSAASVAVIRRPARASGLMRDGARVSVRLAYRAGLVPGVETTDLDHLHPDFRGQVARVVATLGEQGHTVRVAATYRSPVRQDLIWQFSRLMEHLGASPGTRVAGGSSCHNQRLDDAPAAVAIDLRGGRELDLDGRAAFYHALGAASKSEGLRWGGAWKQRNATWARYGLGWDPGHVENQGLCRKLRGL